jgi:hypothetical protein
MTVQITVDDVVGYEVWAAANGVGDRVDDPEGDGQNNLLEYALNGDPSEGEDINPSLIKAGDAVEYIHKQRNDDPSLVYFVQVSSNLMENFWEPAALPVGTNITGGLYDDVTNRIPTVDSSSYIRLKIRDQ